jgi:hypothetical protein
MSESLFSRKIGPGNDVNFSGSPIQSRRQAFLKRVLAFRDGDACVNQRCATFCEPMQGAGDTRLGVASDRGEKIVDRQEEPSLWILLPFLYSSVLS